MVCLLKDRAGAPINVLLHAVYRYENAYSVWLGVFHICVSMFLYSESLFLFVAEVFLKLVLRQKYAPIPELEKFRMLIAHYHVLR